MKRKSLLLSLFILACTSGLFATSLVYNVLDYGIKGDSITYNTAAINKLIETVSQKGGGVLLFPAGNYLSCMIQLKSHITIQLEKGAVLIAAKSNGVDGYGVPELDGDNNKYIDFAHCHWSNSLIYGRDLEDVAIVGKGMIWGRDSQYAQQGKDKDAPQGFLYKTANKGIGLVNCKKVVIKDISIFKGGHFSFKCTGVENLIVENLIIDTYRDGSSIDCCKDVKVNNCLINAPQDDGIVLKSSYALGYKKATENVVITNCKVTANPCGSLLGKSLMKPHRPDLGRIKFGTESNGGFKNITVSNCELENSCGITMETVDGGDLQDIFISDIKMQNVYDTPFFIRLGARLRAPEATPIGKCEHLVIKNIVANNACMRNNLAVMIMGIPNHTIDGVDMSNIEINFKGGGTGDMLKMNVPEQENLYPDPEMWKILPSYGFFIRHAKNIKIDNIRLRFLNKEERPPFYFEDVQNIKLSNIDAQREGESTPYLVMKNVQEFSMQNCKGVKDNQINMIESMSIFK